MNKAIVPDSNSGLLKRSLQKEMAQRNPIDLEDNAVKAGGYGIKNLKRIFPELIRWTSKISVGRLIEQTFGYVTPFSRPGKPREIFPGSR